MSLARRHTTAFHQRKDLTRHRLIECHTMDTLLLHFDAVMCLIKGCLDAEMISKDEDLPFFTISYLVNYRKVSLANLIYDFQILNQTSNSFLIDYII